MALAQRLRRLGDDAAAEGVTLQREKGGYRAAISMQPYSPTFARRGDTAEDALVALWFAVRQFHDDIYGRAITETGAVISSLRKWPRATLSIDSWQIA